MKLSILDQAPITKGNTAADALKKAEELAVRAWRSARLRTNVDGRTSRHVRLRKFSS